MHCPIGNADIVMEKTDELAKIFRIKKFCANNGWLQCSMRSYMNSADLTSSRDYIKRDHRKKLIISAEWYFEDEIKP